MTKVKITRIRYETVGVEACPECKGTKEVYYHDPAGDGHGGLNGGAWGYGSCGCGDGSLEGYERYKEESYNRRYPDLW